MKTPTLHFDTSAIGGYFDAEWMADTIELWKQRAAGKWRLYSALRRHRGGYFFLLMSPRSSSFPSTTNSTDA